MGKAILTFTDLPDGSVSVKLTFSPPFIRPAENKGTPAQCAALSVLMEARRGIKEEKAPTVSPISE